MSDTYAGEHRRQDDNGDGELAEQIAYLDAAGALPGVRAVIAERVRRVRDGMDSGHLSAASLAGAAQAGLSMDDPGSWAPCAAALAAAIDRTEAGQ